MQSSSHEFTAFVQYLEMQHVVCRWCGTHLTTGTMGMYDHENGIMVPGKGKPQWVYIKCKGCNYDWAYHKLLTTAS